MNARGIQARILYMLAGIYCLGALPASTQPFIPGQSYFGANQYIEYIPGNMPIILSAPHGGLLTPAAIPDRDCSGCSTVNDFNTQELARALSNALHARSGCWPHLVINRLHRRKLDANRDLAEAADGDPTAGQAWVDFHQFLETAENEVIWTFGKGFYVDLHGHAHTIQRLELGYLLYADELRLPDDSLNSSTYIGYSSIRYLAENNVQQLSHADLLRGQQSLGVLLSDRGYPATPSFSDPAPAPGQAYFSGGYNTARYSSYNGGSIDGVQIECNRSGIRDSLSQVVRFADTLAVALLDFMERHYFNGLTAALCNSTQAPEPVSPDWEVEVSPNPYCRSFQVVHHDTSADWALEVFDFYGNLRRSIHLPAHTPEQIAFATPGPAFVVLRRNGEIITAQTMLHYCR